MRNITFIALLSVILLLFSCSGNSIKSNISDLSNIELGWIDDHTLRIRSHGIAPNGNQNSKKKQSSAKKAAIIKAHEKLQKRFLSLKKSDSDAYENLKSIIKKGIVFKENFDKNSNCNIVYELKERNLKSLTGAK